MSACLSYFVSLVYVMVALDQAWRGNTPMAVAYTGWAASNVAMLWALK